MSQGTYPTPEPGWVCFHCGEHFPGTFGGQRSAQEHFGEKPCATPACIVKGDKGLLRALRHAEREAARWQNDAHEGISIDRAYYARLESDIKLLKPFKNCRSLQDVFNVYDSMEGRALAAEERLETHSPEPLT